MATWILSEDATVEDLRVMIDKVQSGDAIVIPSSMTIPSEKLNKRLRILPFHPDMLL